jgi:uncharacterized protein involved in exopolysaccharide biosynthesis
MLNAEHIQTEDDQDLVAAPQRPAGTPADPRRVARALFARRRTLACVLLGASVGGVILAKVVLPKTYAANATLLWEPPPALHGEPARELVTLAQSVKLPANLHRVREALHSDQKLESIAKRIDVSFGDNTMLIGITGSGPDPASAAAFTNEVVDVFLGAQREVAANRLRGSVEALRQSLAQSEAALAQSRNTYDAFRSEYKVDDFSLEVQAGITELARLRTSAHDVQVELQGLEAREAALKTAQSSNAPNVVLSTSEQHTDGARLAVSETELAALRSKYSEDHPSVLALSAEVTALRQRAGTLPPAVTSEIRGRNPSYDAIRVQAQESEVLRRATEERAKALADVERAVESRARTLTAVEGQAGRLLADVSTNEEHVNVLLKQLATAEDDVRGATSGFQLVSPAIAPDSSERGIGRIVASALPVFALLIAIALVLAREFRGMRVKTTSEAAYWARAPVLASTSWPADERESIDTLSRYVVDALEPRRGVVGIAAMDDAGRTPEIASAVASRLRWRGKRCAVVDARELPRDAEESGLADSLERGEFTKALAELRATNDVVLVLVPPVSDALSIRASVRGIDSLVVVLKSGDTRAPELAALRATLGLESHGLGIVLTKVPRDLLSWGGRASGDPGLVWRSAQTLVGGES